MGSPAQGHCPFPGERPLLQWLAVRTCPAERTCRSRSRPGCPGRGSHAGVSGCALHSCRRDHGTSRWPQCSSHHRITQIPPTPPEKKRKPSEAVRPALRLEAQLPRARLWFIRHGHPQLASCMSHSACTGLLEDPEPHMDRGERQAGRHQAGPRTQWVGLSG